MPDPGLYRCSKLPLVMACAPSVHADGLAVEGDGAAARLGTAFHRYQVGHIAGREEAVEDLAERYDVDLDDLGVLAAVGRRAWDALRAWYPEPLLEMPLGPAGPLGLAGTADLVSYAAGELRLLDWKSGWKWADARHQLRGYAWLLLQEYDEFQAVNASVVRVREGRVERWQWTRAGLELWHERLVEQSRDTRFRPGLHCGHCPRGPFCEAKTAWLKQAVDAFAVVDPLAELPADADALGALYARLWDVTGMLATYAEKTRELIKADVVARGGRLPSADGRELVVREQQRKVVNLEQAFDVLRDHLAVPEILRAAGVSLAKLKAAVGAHAPRRSKGLAVRDMVDRLAEEGCLEIHLSQRLEVRHAGTNAVEVGGAGQDAGD